MVEKDRRLIFNKTYLLKMLPPLYQKYLENQLEESELLFFNLMINLLQELKEVSLEKLANALLPILFESRRNKIQIFLSLPILQLQKFFLPLISDWLAQSFSPNERVYLAIDRTKWDRKNLIMISRIYDQRAIPIYFEFFPKLGHSDFAQQSRVLSEVIPLFKKYNTIVLGEARMRFCHLG